MQRVSSTKSMLAFNQRVLASGYVDEDDKLTPRELKQKLFFNQVFVSNMIEMYQKNAYMSNCTDEYIKLLNQYIANIGGIIGTLNRKSNLNVNTYETFERRLATEVAIGNSLITHYFDEDIEARGFQYDPDTVYFITMLPKQRIAISYVDPKRSIYQKYLFHKHPKYKEVFMTDYAIKTYVDNMFGIYGTVAVRVVTNLKTKKVCRVEYHGHMEAMKRLITMFPGNALILSNPYLYTGNLMQLLDDLITDDVQPSPVYKPVKFSEVFLKDKLIEFPNDSFDEYLQLLRMAANTEDTKAIYLTLYRIGSDPDIFYILRDAARKGIHVHVNVELFASGEAINKFWLRELMNADIHVTTYGAGTLKVHSKLTLIEFTNGNAIAQIGTGNYHTRTTSQYTDLCLLTSDYEVCRQVRDVFRLFDGDNHVDFNDDFLVTRYNAHEHLIHMIEQEGNKGSNGYIAIKCNALDDDAIIESLSRAAFKGAKIDLIIRGICTWIPDPETNVRVKSIVWDKLEHSRVYCFGKTNPTIYMGSLDLLTGKLKGRIETLVQIKDPDVTLSICKYLNRYITNTDESWILNYDGTYTKEV